MSSDPYDSVIIQQHKINRLEVAIDELSRELQIARSTLHAAELENNASRVQHFLKCVTELQDRLQTAERRLLVAEEHLAALARERAAIEERRTLADQHNVAMELQRVKDTRSQNSDSDAATGTSL